MRIFHTLQAALFLCATGTVLAEITPAPKAPSGLKVTPLGMNTFLMEWRDNSTNEKGWEIRLSANTVTNAARFQLVPAPNQTSYIVFLDDFPDRTFSFQIGAYNGETGEEQFSDFTPVVTAKALGRSTFDAPTAMSAVALDDGRIRIGWNDNTTSEFGYQVQVQRGGKGPWKDLTYTNPKLSYSETVEGLDPTIEYSFRARAYKGGTRTIFTGFSNIATVSTMPFRAPKKLRARLRGENGIVLLWNDLSTVETGFEVESRIGNAPFEKLGDVGANVDKTDPITGFLSNKRHVFRVRAFRTVKDRRIYSDYTNLAIAKTPLIKKPTDFTLSELTDSSVKLKWKDAATIETGYIIQFRLAGDKTFNTLTTTAANVVEYQVNGLAANVAYEFRVGATDGSTPSFTPSLKATAKQGIAGNLSPPIFAGRKFLYQIQFSSDLAIGSITVTGLPPGLVFDEATRTISGTVAEGTSQTATITALFPNGESSTRALVLKVTDGVPTAIAGFAPLTLPVSGVRKVSIKDKFVDSDTQSAARVVTTLGNFDIILFPDSTPLTTNNFLDYVDEGRYRNVFFHRAPKDFVVQGGGFLHTPAGGFSRVPKFPEVKNEPGLSNVRGTVAMAKIGGQPDSATSEFFVNLSDGNAPNLDAQNEGFTVFGRVADPGMPLLDAINNLPRGSYTIPLPGGAQPLDDVPVNATSAPAAINPSTLVKITNVGAAPILTYTVESKSTQVATAGLDEKKNLVIIKGISKGKTEITVRAIDLDGKTIAQTIPVTVE